MNLSILGHYAFGMGEVSRDKREVAVNDRLAHQ